MNLLDDTLRQHSWMKDIVSSPLQELVNSIRERRPHIGLSEVAEIMRSAAEQIYPAHLKLFGDNVEVYNLAKALSKNSGLVGITSSLADIIRDNPLIPQKIFDLTNSQLSLTKNLSDIVNAARETHLMKFNTLSVALKGISSNYLKDILQTQNWEDLEIAEEANEVMTTITDEVLDSKSRISLDDLYNLRLSIITQLTTLVRKTKTQKARDFLLNLIAVIGFLLTLYSTYQSAITQTTNEVIQDTKKEIEKLNKELSCKIDSELNKLNKTRIAKSNAQLKYSTKKHSQIIGVVKSGQQVTVLEIRQKFLLISYIDFATSEPKSGFVEKKFFSPE